MQELCNGFYAKGEHFDLIGHTSNTLYLPDYSVDSMVSTRKLTRFEINDDSVTCECGVSVKKLAKEAVEAGIKGFEGLVDLPGTVAAAIYGNAGCFNCYLSNLLLSASVLTSDGQRLIVEPNWFAFARRSSSLKRGEKNAIILSLTLRKEIGNKEDLARIAQQNHEKRKQTQPDPHGTLGSVFNGEGKPTLLYWTLHYLTKILYLPQQLLGKEQIYKKRVHLMFRLLGAMDVEPYVYHWNCYHWEDEKAHDLFWKYVGLHRKLFTRSEFEIEIKHNTNFKIP